MAPSHARRTPNLFCRPRPRGRNPPSHLLYSAVQSQPLFEAHARARALPHPRVCNPPPYNFLKPTPGRACKPLLSAVNPCCCPANSSVGATCPPLTREPHSFFITFPPPHGAAAATLRREKALAKKGTGKRLEKRRGRLTVPEGREEQLTAPSKAVKSGSPPPEGRGERLAAPTKVVRSESA